MNKEQEQQYQHALDLLSDAKYLKAAAILEDLINAIPSDKVAKALVLALYRARQYARAFVYFIEQPETFTSDRGNARLAVHLALHNQSYVLARLFIAELPVDWQDELKRVVKNAEQDARKNYQTTIQTLLRSFYHLGDCSLNEQQERLSAAQQLPLKEYLTGAQFLLRDPYAHPLIKASLVDTLRQLEVNQQVVLRWIDGQEYPLVPEDLLSIDDMALVHDLRAELADQLGEQNPSEYRLANQELQMQLMILYPLINQKIPNARVWIHCLINNIRGGQGENDQQVDQLQKKLTKIIDDLGEKP